VLHIGRQTTTSTFSGEVYLVAMYNQYFDQTSVTTNFNAYLPNSAPYTLAYTPTAIGEFLVGNVSLQAYDYDIQVNQSWALSEAASGSTTVKPTSLQPSALIYRILSPLPLKGNLSSTGYGTNNDVTSFLASRLTSSSLPYTVTRTDNLVFYRSVQYTFGTNYASLTFDVRLNHIATLLSSPSLVFVAVSC
jgi:hypothetical protein